MGPKTDALRAMREQQAADYERLQSETRRMTRKLAATRAELDKAVSDAAAKVAAKPKRKPMKGRLKDPLNNPFIPIDDTMLVPTGSLTKKPKRKAARHK